MGGGPRGVVVLLLVIFLVEICNAENVAIDTCMSGVGEPRVVRFNELIFFLYAPDSIFNIQSEFEC